MKSITIWAGLLMLGSIAWAAGQTIQLEGVFPRDNSAAPLAMAKARVKVEIYGLAATTDYELTLANTSGRWARANFILPQSPRRTLAAFQMDVFGKMIDAQAIERTRGRAVFETIVANTRDPGLAEWLDESRLKFDVYPVSTSKDIVLRFDEILPVDDLGARMRIPLGFPVPVKEFSLQIQARDVDGAPAFVDFPAEGAQFTSQDGAWTAAWEAKDWKTPEGITLTFPRDRARPTLLTEAGEGGKQYQVRISPGRQELNVFAEPRSITIYWDLSGSQSPAAVQSVLGILEAYFKQVKNTKVQWVEFGLAPETHAFEVQNGQWDPLRERIAQLTYEGGTRLDNLRLDQAEGEVIFVVSDGILSWGKAPAPLKTDKRVIVLGEGNSPWLSHLVGVSNGRHVNLKATPAEAVQLIQSRPAPMPGVPDSTSRSLEDRQILQAAFTEASDDDANPFVTSPGLTRRLWTRERYHAMHAGLIGGDALQFAQENHLVTPETSLIVLENARDYLNSGLAVPEGIRSWTGPADHIHDPRDRWAPADLVTKARAAWNAPAGPPMLWQPDDDDGLSKPDSILRKEEKMKPFLAELKFYELLAREKPSDFPDRFSQLVRIRLADEPYFEGAAYRRERSRLPAPTGFLTDPDVRDQLLSTRWRIYTQGDPFSGATADMGGGGGLMGADPTVGGDPFASLGPEQPAAKAAAPAEVPEADRETADGLLKAWNGVDFTKAFRDRPPSEWAAIYANSRKENAKFPAFYLVVADFLAANRQKVLALRVLSNLPELAPADPSLLRITGRALARMGELELAEDTFQRLAGLAPNDVISYRELALVREARGDFQDALDAYLQAVRIHAKGVEFIALRELAVHLWRHGDKLDLSKVPPEWRQLHEPLDLRIVLDWDTRDMDLDLYVTTPSGQICYYNQTNLPNGGGQLSGDQTDSGPEEFVLAKAAPGKYHVALRLAGGGQVTSGTPPIARVSIWRNYGRAGETVETHDVPVYERDVLVPAATLTWKAP